MIKRLFDLVSSIIGLIILSPLFLIIAILIKIDSKGGVFYQQVRVGKNYKEFKIYKFRSMNVVQEKDASQITIGNDDRITKIGHFIRKYKIDEIPQLINVIKGEMSLVGPRPEVPKYVQYYKKLNSEIVLSVKPGITDIASIKFRSESKILGKEENPYDFYVKKIMPKKLRYCRFYVKKQSFFLDIYIIFKTLYIAVRG